MIKNLRRSLIKKMIFLVILFATTLIITPAFAAIAPIKISDNGIYTWWTHNLATKLNNDILFSAIDDSGVARIYKNGSFGQSIVMDDNSYADDHNMSSILANPGKDLLAFYTVHGGRNYISYRRAPEGTLNFGRQKLIHFSSSPTYSQILNKGDTIIVFTRVGSGWNYIISTDYGETWSDERIFINTGEERIYLLFTESEVSPGLYHFAGAQNPSSEPPYYIVYGNLELESGNVFGGNEIIGNIYSQEGLPILKSSLSSVYPIENENKKIRLLDVGDKHGKTVIYYAKLDDGINYSYYQAVRNQEDGTWDNNFIGIYAGEKFHPTSLADYIGGMALDRNGNNWLYISNENNGTWYIKRYEINQDMTLGESIVLAEGNYPLVRPYSVRGADSVIYQQLIKYNDCNDYRAFLWRSDQSIDITGASGSIKINNGYNYTRLSKVKLSLLAFDASGVYKMRFSNNGLSWTSWMDYKLYSNWSLTRLYGASTSQGRKVVYAQYLDRYSNRSNTYQDKIIYDYVPPVGTILINGGKKSTNSRYVTLNLHSVGTYAPTRYVRFSNNGKRWTAWQSYRRRILKWNITSARYGANTKKGVKYVYAQFKDVVSNASSVKKDSIIFR